jgi:hypothetical protein
MHEIAVGQFHFLQCIPRLNPIQFSIYFLLNIFYPHFIIFVLAPVEIANHPYVRQFSLNPFLEYKKTLNFLSGKINQIMGKQQLGKGILLASFPALL